MNTLSLIQNGFFLGWMLFSFIATLIMHHFHNQYISYARDTAPVFGVILFIAFIALLVYNNIAIGYSIGFILSVVIIFYTHHFFLKRGTSYGMYTLLLEGIAFTIPMYIWSRNLYTLLIATPFFLYFLLKKVVKEMKIADSEYQKNKVDLSTEDCIKPAHHELF